MENLDPRFADYLDGTMPSNEQAQFEAEWGQNPSLQAQWEELEALHGALQARSKQLLWEEVADAIVQAPKRRRNFNVYVAGSIAAAAAVFLLLLFWPDKSSPRELAQELHQQFPYALETNMGTAGNDAFATFQNQDYKSAIQDLNTIPVDSPAFREAQLCLADAHLHLHQNAKSIAILKQEFRLEGPISSAEDFWATWLLALAYSLEGNFAQARPLWTKVQGSDAYLSFDMREAVEELLEAMEH